MHNMDIRNINFGQLEYFVNTAKLGSFAKTAEYMHVSQSTVSKSIQSLEQMLGIPLFWRERRAIHLTPAGQYLYEQWKKMTMRIEMNVNEAHVIQAGYSRSLAIGSLDSHNPEMFIMPAVRNFKNYYGQANVRVETSPAQDLRRMLLDDELDIVFTVLYEIEQLGLEDFEVRVLGECNHIAAMLKSNPLAQKESLSVEDLKESHFLAISPQVTPSYAVMLKNLCEPFGFTPNITCYTASAVALAFNLMDNSDIFICDKFYQGIVNPALATVPLKGTRSGFVMAWKKINNKPLVEQFVTETQNLFHSVLE